MVYGLIDGNWWLNFINKGFFCLGFGLWSRPDSLSLLLACFIFIYSVSVIEFFMLSIWWVLWNLRNWSNIDYFWAWGCLCFWSPLKLTIGYQLFIVPKCFHRLGVRDGIIRVLGVFVHLQMELDWAVFCGGLLRRESGILVRYYRALDGFIFYFRSPF